MDSSTFHAALKATARVACAVAVFTVADAGVSLASEGARAPQADGPSTRAPEVAGQAALGPRAGSLMEYTGPLTSEDAQARRIQTEALTPGTPACNLLAHLGYYPVGCTPWGPPVPPRMPAAEVA